ncbi:Polysaccharide deacetylase [Phaffia rhodozyma]|uniref:chitin deacetylase n=1 Tax=Phaffia rhodozyma TaxID=264483 RepID=A0A0F7SUR7_PHARH|nr:Polysaccharide deacetylase [Phaffia rhodozyma]
MPSPTSLVLLAFLSSALAAPSIVDLHKLFPRQSSDLAVGSDAWKASYPSAQSTPTDIPQAWLDALNTAVAAGKIPNIVPATMTNGWPSYSDGSDPSSAKICHYTVGCVASTDRINAPDGMMGVAQDDGPLAPGVALVDFYNEKNISSTHFYIGSNVVYNVDVMQHAMTVPGQHFAVHTWTHPYMSSLTNAQVVAELGWTMKVIADVNGGKIPAWWRPPYGDVDNRVRAIASEVFGLTTVIWNQDTADWTLGTTGKVADITNNLQGFINGAKSPGLLILEHELYTGCVDAFKSVYPSMVSQGWDMRSIPDLWGENWYKNAVDESSAISNVGIVGSTNVTASAATSASASSVASASSAASSSYSAQASGSVSSTSVSSMSGVSSSVRASSSASARSTSASAFASASAVSSTSGATFGVRTTLGLGAVALVVFIASLA